MKGVICIGLGFRNLAVVPVSILDTNSDIHIRTETDRTGYSQVPTARISKLIIAMRVCICDTHSVIGIGRIFVPEFYLQSRNDIMVLVSDFPVSLPFC